MQDHVRHPGMRQAPMQLCLGNLEHAPPTRARVTGSTSGSRQARGRTMDRARYPSKKSVAAAATKMALHASGACGDPLNHTASHCSQLQGGLHRALQQGNTGLRGGRTCKEHRDGSHASEREQRRQREHLRCMQPRLSLCASGKATNGLVGRERAGKLGARARTVAGPSALPAPARSAASARARANRRLRPCLSPPALWRAWVNPATRKRGNKAVSRAPGRSVQQWWTERLKPSSRAWACRRAAAQVQRVPPVRSSMPVACCRAGQLPPLSKHDAFPGCFARTLGQCSPWPRGRRATCCMEAELPGAHAVAGAQQPR